MPQILGIIACLGVAVVFFSFKIHSKKVRFVHFYLLALGDIFFIANAVYFYWSEYLESVKGLYFGGVGHGIIYTTGLSYMHFRLASNEFRIFKIGLCHIVYLIGIVSTVHGVELISVDLEKIFTKVRHMILSSATIGFMLLLINETLHAGGLFDYKMCRDEELNAANEKGDLFQSALAFSPFPRTDGNAPAHDNTREPNQRRQTFLTLLMIFSKIKNYMTYHAVFVAFFVFFSEDFFRARSYFAMHYLVLLGAITGLCISLKLNTKTIYIVSAICVSICVLILMIFKLTAVILFGLYSLPIILMYFHLGLSYFIPDCAIMEMANIKCTEASLALGYMAETIPHLITIATMKCSKFSHFDSFWHSTVIFIVILTLLCVMIIKWIPKTWSLSILEIQHLVLYGENRWKPQQN
ncbi:uncharacterized protein LOC132263982 [Phlebotomus argentipes]|uniref:uncharacterized protein LOC132263982 n=1 Tax=Phlebotomus argentipes TaxID=94469 RepID=UPI002892E21D|nr:uncharacterized protein LOC132263982 [Phlebotomus argentipes]